LKYYLSEHDKDFVDQIISKLEDNDFKKTINRNAKLTYTLFDGHQSRLSHYFRHLYHTTKYVDLMPVSKARKEQYMKILRAQLSVHEQALLLINSLTPLGKKWWDNDYMTKYEMARNLLANFFDPTREIDLYTIFPKGYFESDEIEGL
jgi:hypothetical protein